MSNYLKIPRKYGWVKGEPVETDKSFLLSVPIKLQSVDLREKFKFPDVYDQGTIGSCTANAIAGIVEFNLLNAHSKSAEKPFMPSRLFIYYNEREMEGDVEQDGGAQIRDGIVSVANQGVCTEDEWVYSQQNLFCKPTQQCYDNAMNCQALDYYSVVGTKKNIVGALLLGFPVTCGITVFESFESDEVAETGIAPYPDINNEQMLGGHAVMIVGYDLTKDVFIFRNSWGSNWGQNGYFTLPAHYVTNHQFCSDFWVIKLVE